MNKTVELLVGMRCKVYNHTIDGREILEGVATIKEVLRMDYEGIIAMVEFDNDIGGTYRRVIDEQNIIEEE